MMSVPVSAFGRRRWRRWHVVMLVLLCTVVALVWWHQRTERFHRLVSEIKQSGGTVQLGTSAWVRLRDRIQGWSGEAPTTVRLTGGTTKEWVRSWDGLTDLSINALKVDQGADLGPELARLVARHPIDVLYAPGAKGADEMAAALSASQTLAELNLRDSDLTDEGLRRLPLERLRKLNIAGTGITVKGLSELRRLPWFSMVVLDGRQVSVESVSVLEQKPEVYRLWTRWFGR